MAGRLATPVSSWVAPATREGGRADRRTCRSLLSEALQEPVIVVENGRRRKIPKRQAIVTQLVNRSAKADLKAIQILLMMLRDIESRADPGSADPAAFTEADQQIIKRIRARLRGEKDKP
jgi:uncharacterized protein DUF5681